jgi:hypothetical protein
MAYGSCTMYFRNRAPSPGTNSFSATAGGSGWNTSKYYPVLVVAWYDADETNVYKAGAVNYGYNYELTSLYYEYEENTAFEGVSPANTTDELTVTWTHPDGPQPHHYSVYLQKVDGANTAYDVTKVGWKQNTSDIAPDQTSYTVTDLEVVGSSTRDFTVVNHSWPEVWVDGNVLAEMAHVTCIIDPGGLDAGRTITKTELKYNARGVQTVATFSSTDPGLADGMTFRLVGGDIVAQFQQASGQTPTWGIGEVISIAPTVDFRPMTAEYSHRAGTGYMARTSRAIERMTDAIRITVNGTACTHAEWRILMNWMEAQATVWLIDRSENLTDKDYPLYPQYLGKIMGTDYIGSVGKTSRKRFNIDFAVDEEAAQGEGLF